jgi:hypothetical protein
MHEFLTKLKAFDTLFNDGHITSKEHAEYRQAILSSYASLDMGSHPTSTSVSSEPPTSSTPPSVPPNSNQDDGDHDLPQPPDNKDDDDDDDGNVPRKRLVRTAHNWLHVAEHPTKRAAIDAFSHLLMALRCGWRWRCVADIGLCNASGN